MAQLSLTESPDFVLALAESAQVVAHVAQHRSDYIGQLWGRLVTPEGVSHCLLLFGGIASELCDEQAAHAYLDWLEREPAAHLFVCYESGPSAEARARLLNERRLDSTHGLPVAAQDRK